MNAITTLAREGYNGWPRPKVVQGLVLDGLEASTWRERQNPRRPLTLLASMSTLDQ